MERTVARVFRVPIEGDSLETLLDSMDPRNVQTSSIPKMRWVVTANPEILLEARRDPAYADAIRSADTRSVDGFGLWLLLYLSRITHHASRTDIFRVTGVELAEALIQKAATDHLHVALVGGRPGVAKRAAEMWKRRFPGLQILAEQGGMVQADGQDDTVGQEMRTRLTLFAPQILLVAFGHPKQERWLARYLSEFPSVTKAVGVGGTFDYWAGTVLRAPRFFRSVGLEWLWRLCIEPRRWKRIWNAVVVFPILFLFP